MNKDSSAAADATLVGTVERVVFSNPDSGFAVLHVEPESGGERITVVGLVYGVGEGEHLRMTGRYETDRQYGRQFRLESFVPVKPSTVVGIQKYLSSGMVKGIGPTMAERLVERFGLQTLDVIEKDLERLCEVPGIGPVRVERIGKAWQEQRGIHDVMVFLQSHGVTTSHASRIWKRYGREAVSKLRRNPYRLAEEIVGIGFPTADRIAQQMGIETSSPLRAAAGVLHVLRDGAAGGHTFLPQDTVCEGAAGLLSVERDAVLTAVETLVMQGYLIREARPEDDVNPALYLPLHHRAEISADEELRRLLSSPPPAPPADAQNAVAAFEARGQRLAEGQRQALRTILESKVAVVTGGPGTGKTTLVNAALQLLGGEGTRPVLCAPTGRAAKRLSESTGRSAQTLHRLLEFQPKERRFTRDRTNPLEADLVIVDETSMVDIHMFGHLLRAIPDGCRLVLVGDVDQLPSVGPGRVLADLIDSAVLPVARLHEIFRQEAGSQIVLNAHRINSGELPQLGDGEDFFFIERDDPQAALEVVKEMVVQRIPRRFQLDPVQSVQVLAPMHKGVLGVANLNQQLQALLNPGGRPAVRGDGRLRVGDKVMQVRNNYDLDVFNGDVGRVVGANDEERELHVVFDQRRVTYEASQLDELVLAYACSIHKSQGSEYPAVVIPLHTQHFVLLRRNLLYTAVTRGSRLVVIVGSRRAMGLAVRNHGDGGRHTGLAQRLRAQA